MRTSSTDRQAGGGRTERRTGSCRARRFRLACGAWTALGALLASCTPHADPPNVVLIVVDTLRADRLGVYGHPGRTTPGLDALAAEGVVFRSCVAQAPWTTPAMGAILTGHFPSTHGADWMTSSLSASVTTLAERFRDAGWTTAAFVSHRLAGRQYGFARGFEAFDQSNAGGHDHVSSKILVNLAERWLDRRDATRPFFLMLHFFDPHYNFVEHRGFTDVDGYDGPLRPGTDIWELRESDLDAEDLGFLEELYSGEVRFLDRQLVRLRHILAERGLDDGTILVLVADHGEEFLQHGWLGHTTGLWQGMVKVPLIVRAPGRLEPALRNEIAMQVDLHPTLLRLAGLRRDDGPGRDLFSGSDPERSIVSEVEFAPRDDAPPRNAQDAEIRRAQIVKMAIQRSVQRGSWKAIEDRVTGEWRLFDLATDPGERVDVAAQHPAELARLTDALVEWEESIPAGDGGSVQLSAEDLERLRALGYTK